MGVYLSSPITEKNSIDGQCEHFIYGASSMQGWRINQEDAHNCIPVFDENTKTSFFAVYDGHGGSEVAKYCERHFPEFMKKLMKVHDGASGDPTLFIKNAFLAFDATLTNEDVIKELKQLAGKDDDNEEDENDNPVGRSETDLLKEEAKMPLGHLLTQYENSTTREIKDVHKEDAFQSPALRSKRGSASDARTSSQSAENGLPSASCLSTSSSLSSCIKQDSSSEASDDVLDVKDSSMTISTQNEDTVNTDTSDNECSVTNNNNIDKVALPSTHTNLGPAVIDTVLPLPSSLNEGKDKIAKKPCHSEEEIDENHQTASCNSSLSYSSQLDESSRGVLSSLTSDVGSSGSNEGVVSSKSKAAGDIDMVDGDTSSDEEEEDEDLWEDMSEEEEDEDGQDEGVSMMDMSNEEPGSDSGCTACVVLMQDKKLIVANAGDSRCLLSRAGKAIDLSFDHKPEDDTERERIIKAGGKVTADGRVNGGLNLSRAIGDHVYKRNKVLSAKEQMITALPDIETAELCDEDQFIIIACDGIWNYLTSQEVVDYVLEKLKDPENSKKPSLICEQLFDRCLAPNTYGDGTGCDNMTCIIIVLNTFMKSGVQQTATEAADTKSTSHINDQTCSVQQFSSINDKEDTGSGSLKRCADSVEIPEGKRLKVEEEVA